MASNDKPVIAGFGFIEWLIDQGVIDDGPITRVVIDAPYNGAVDVTVYMRGNLGLIDGDAPASFAELREVMKTIELVAS